MKSMNNRTDLILLPTFTSKLKHFNVVSNYFGGPKKYSEYLIYHTKNDLNQMKQKYQNDINQALLYNPSLKKILSNDMTDCYLSNSKDQKKCIKMSEIKHNNVNQYISDGITDLASIIDDKPKVSINKSVNKSEHRTLIIVGGGISALSAAIYAARASLSPLLILGSVKDQEQIGGQLMLTNNVENYPGTSISITGEDLINNCLEQVKNLNVEIIEEWADSFHISNNNKKIQVKNITYTCDSLILATGSTARWLNLPNESKYIGNGLSCCVSCDGFLPMYRNKRLIVVGGGDTALYDALQLTKVTKDVIILVRSNKLRAQKILQQKVSSNQHIKIYYNSKLIEYIGDKKLSHIKIETNFQNEIKSLLDKSDVMSVGGVFIAIGHDPGTKHLEKTDLNLTKSKHIEVHHNIKTNIPGVFAAGDVADERYKQAITAAAFGAMAALEAEKWLEFRNKSA